jgi:Rrf2 family protein
MLLTKTTELGIQSLIYLAHAGEEESITPPRMAELLGSSPTYMSKVLSRLAKGGILNSRRGVAGGFTLAREPMAITLLDVVRACQGAVPGNYCTELAANQQRSARTCGYHQAMVELHEAVQEVLGQWTIQDIHDSPPPGSRTSTQCKMQAILSRLG